MRVRSPHSTHANDSRDADQTVGPLHFRHGQGAGGRQHAHPQPVLQYQNRNKNPPARTPTASGLRHLGQVVVVGTLGLVRGIRPDGRRSSYTVRSSSGGYSHRRVPLFTLIPKSCVNMCQHRFFVCRVSIRLLLREPGKPEHLTRAGTGQGEFPSAPAFKHGETCPVLARCNRLARPFGFDSPPPLIRGDAYRRRRSCRALFHP